MILFFKENIYLFILIFILIWIAIFKIWYPFWNLQPVYHKYDFWRWIYWKPFVFYRHQPMKTKFCDFLHVRTISFADMSPVEMGSWVDFVQTYYLSTDRIFCVMNQPYLYAHMTGFQEPAYISFYKEKIDFLPLEYQPDQSLNTHLGWMVSRPTTLYFKDMPPILAYFWDFMCMHRNYVKKNISRKLIQTHEYNQRLKNPTIQVSIFKKEIILCDGVVPITQYKTRTYYLEMIQPPKLPTEYECIRISKENTQLLYEFLASMKTKSTFDFCMIPDYGHIIALINEKIWLVFILKCKDVICGIYFFKDLYLHYEDIDVFVADVPKNADDLGNSIHLFASIQNIETPLFYLGFHYSLYLILKYNPKYRILLMEEIADNSVLLKLWNRPPIFETDTAYYLFNYFYPRIISPEKCLLLI
jgi:hypothetical protein